MEEMFAYINLSAAEIAQGHAKEAFDWLKKAFELSASTGERAAEGWAHYYRGHAHLLNDEFDLAAQSFTKSMEIRMQVSAPALVMESRSGLCETYLKSGDLDAAKSEAGQIADYIEENRTLEGMEEPLRAFLSVISVFDESEDPRSRVVLGYATQLLDAQVSKLYSKEARRKFVENAPWRHKIWRLAKADGSIS
jgi:tetratricopeptide (TPR) repeat protein